MRQRTVCALSLAALLAISATSASSDAFAQTKKPRARELGIPFEGTTGPNNAITDVPGVEVGQVTLISGEGRLVVGKGPVRTGVTAIFPRGKRSDDAVFAAQVALNGNGEMTGAHWVKENGFVYGPVLITNTLSVGTVRDATVAWTNRQGWDHFLFSLPVVAETWDGGLNDIDGFHVKPEHVFQALDQATGGPVTEGNVGGGTGMVCHQFKGGIGTASRRLPKEAGGYTVGVLVQCNYGRRSRLSVLGVPVGREIRDLMPCATLPQAPRAERFPACTNGQANATVGRDGDGSGSIIIVVATDAPLLPNQLERVARRAGLGVGRMGGLGEDSSGDIFLAFSTANPGAGVDTGTVKLTMLPNDRINPVFEATVSATEEAIVNALVAAETMTGADGHRVYALPTDRLVAAMKKYGRM
ncbi:MAG TPA: P1 family peptidase [Gemmatimonadales bacterium]|nr:P1 family peptidase [Gemmatimonadales bacterium]